MRLFSRSSSRGSGQSRLIFSVGFVTLLLVFGIISYDREIGTVRAGASHNMSGWAWSDNIGWISFNSLNSAPGPDYGVNASLDATGNPAGLLSGYAWSDNIGWISFGCVRGGECFTTGESDFPTGGGLRQAAQITSSKLQGWARACSVFVSGCSGTLKDNEVRGDWDGWISLSGTNPNYGVEYFPGATPGVGLFGEYNNASKSYAWGHTNVGWVNFRPLSCAGGQDPSRCGVILGRPELGLSSCTAVAEDGTAGSSQVKTTWTASAYGGTGIYTYDWTSPETGRNGVTCAPEFPTDPSSVTATLSNIVCRSNGLAGKVSATVTVTDSAGTTFSSNDLPSSQNTCGTGINVVAPVEGYSLQTNRENFSAVCPQTGPCTATTTPVTIVSIVPFGSPSPAFKRDVNLSGSVDAQTLATLGLSESDVLFQFSRETITNPTTWPYETPTIKPTRTSSGSSAVNDSYAPVSLQVVIKKRPRSNARIPVQVVGVTDDTARLTARATIYIDLNKGTSDIIER